MKRWTTVVALLSCSLIGSVALAQAPQAATDASAKPAAPALDQWLMRLHEASRGRAYSGTFVVTTGQFMSSSRIWHVCDGQQQVERVDALTGEPRTTFRRNDQVVTFWPQHRVALQERRESLGLFPELLRQADSSLGQFYRLSLFGRERVAGVLAEIAQLTPLDAWRFGFRVWTERNTGLLVKLQTLDANQTVLEQAAFSELQLNAPVQMARLRAEMDNTQGYAVRQAALVKTSAEQEGWILKSAVPGFKPVSCNRRSADSLPGGNPQTLQCVYSDGLATVSLFMEPFDAARHPTARTSTPLSMGATQVLMRQLGAWWLTAVGEVPVQTLQAFAQGLERTK